MRRARGSLKEETLPFNVLMNKTNTSSWKLERKSFAVVIVALVVGEREREREKPLEG